MTRQPAGEQVPIRESSVGGAPFHGKIAIRLSHHEGQNGPTPITAVGEAPEHSLFKRHGPLNRTRVSIKSQITVKADRVIIDEKDERDIGRRKDEALFADSGLGGWRPRLPDAWP
ncbi:MAG: hypothetical protein HOP28_17990 [Gemmatimonadales bacterium]|nr:hypothetical protein [Gemmatimonadales bacterium]